MGLSCQMSMVKIIHSYWKLQSITYPNIFWGIRIAVVGGDGSGSEI
jgi:hypothetical protein